MPLLDAYIRVSAVRGRKGPAYISPSEQRAGIERWAAYKNVQIGEWIVDEDQSGGTHDRPGLERAIDRATSGVTTGIVCAKIDRFSRLTEHGLRDLRRLQEAGSRLAFVHEDVDVSGPLGKVVYTLMLAQAEYFLDQIKAGWIAAKTRAVERGAYISRTPFGYQRNDDGTIQPHPIEAPLAQEAFRLAASSLHAAAHHLAGHDQRIWTVTTTRRMLARRVYLGETRIGEFSGNTHQPLVTRAQWEAAQSTRPTRQTSSQFPLSGLILCGTCEQPMIGGHGGRHSSLRVYKCSAVAAGRSRTVERCPAGAVISANRIEAHLRDLARELLAGAHVEIDHAEHTAHLAELEQAMVDAETELDTFAGDLTARRLLGDRYHDHLETRAAAAEQARGRYRDAAREAATDHALEPVDIDDAEVFAIVLGRIFGPILVSRGRGVPVGERVSLGPADPDRGRTRVAAPVESE